MGALSTFQAHLCHTSQLQSLIGGSDGAPDFRLKKKTQKILIFHIYIFYMN